MDGLTVDEPVNLLPGLKALIAEQAVEIVRLRALVEARDARIAELERRVEEYTTTSE